MRAVHYGSSEPHPRVTYWREVLQRLILIESDPAVQTRVQIRHTYEATLDPGVAVVDA